MIYRVSHTTSYDYPEDVSISHNLAHLKARDTPGQTRLAHRFETSVPPSALVDHHDFFGNPVVSFTIQEPHRSLRIHSFNVVDVVAPDPVDPAASAPWEEACEALRTRRDPVTLNAYQHRFDSPMIRDVGWLADYALASFPPGRTVVAGALDLTRRIHADFKYDPAATTNATPIAEVFKMKRGVCQDFAHLQIGCLRSIGLAARYVSGYLRTNPPPGKPRLVGADASHAWLAVYCTRLGWVDLDPTNNQIPGDKHVTLAWGRDYDDVSPIKGVILGGGGTTLRVAVDVIAEDEAPPTQGAWNDQPPERTASAAG